MTIAVEHHHQLKAEKEEKESVCQTSLIIFSPSLYPQDEDKETVCRNNYNIPNK